MKKTKLNIGCGRDIRADFINCDCVFSDRVDKVFDLNIYPYPFKDNQFEEIACYSVLEHLESPERVIEEMWRISRPNAKVIIVVPHFSCWQAWGDLTHRRPFNSTSLFSFSNKKSHRDSSSLINTHKEKFNVDSRILFGRIKKFFLFERIFNVNNYLKGFYERHLAYIFPAENILFELETIK